MTVLSDPGVIPNSLSLNLRKMSDKQAAQSSSPERGGAEAENEAAATPAAEGKQQSSPVLPTIDSDNAAPEPLNKENRFSDMEMMREKFCKLLLGEDMSGGGKGVSSALAVSNAITNLAASVFGEQRRLEPMDPERKARWKKEINWLLSITDYIVEFVACQQKSPDGTDMEVMTTQQRLDLRMNIPALRKLDVMLVSALDNFKDEQEYRYVSRDASEPQTSGKWWLPNVKVPPNGLSEESRLFLQKQKEIVNQVLKASMAINSQILSDIEIPDSYIEALPKTGRQSLGEAIYRGITDEFFDPSQFLSTLDLTSDLIILDLKDRIEASIVIWKRKLNNKDFISNWILGVNVEKREVFEERVETLLQLLKQQFPGIPQSSLEISKIQYNKDVGLSILESYSRVLETMASTVMSRIQDVLYADSLARDPSLAAEMMQKTKPCTPSPPKEEEASEAPAAASMTLSDFMGWEIDTPDTHFAKSDSIKNIEQVVKDEEVEGEVVSESAKADEENISGVEKIEMTNTGSPMPNS